MLRAIAILGVIIIHISSPVVNVNYAKNMEFWWIGNIVDSAVRFSVPIFLMLSGATLLRKEYKPKEFYKKRVLRVLVPFLFWMVVYWIYRWAMLSPNQQPQEFQTIIQWGVNIFLKEGISKHFWYVYMILFIYLFVPFAGKWLHKLNLTILSNILLIWVLLAFACKSIPLNMYSWNGEYETKLLGYFLHSGYLLLGYYLTRLPALTNKIRLSAAVIFILSIAVSAVAAYFYSKAIHKNDLSIYSYLSINSIIQSIAIFMLIKDVTFHNKLLNMIVQTTSKYSFGIYLAHILIIGIFFRNGIFWTMAHPLISLPLLVVMVFVCSFGIIFVLRKIPGGKYVAG